MAITNAMEMEQWLRQFAFRSVIGIWPFVSAGALELQVQTTYPAAEVVQFCTGTRKAVPGSVDTRPEEFGVISPVIFGMPLPDSDDLRVCKDKKSLIVKKKGWTWTLTPSIVPSK